MKHKSKQCVQLIKFSKVSFYDLFIPILHPVTTSCEFLSWKDAAGPYNFRFNTHFTIFFLLSLLISMTQQLEYQLASTKGSLSQSPPQPTQDRKEPGARNSILCSTNVAGVQTPEPSPAASQNTQEQQVAPWWGSEIQPWHKVEPGCGCQKASPCIFIPTLAHTLQKL